MVNLSPNGILEKILTIVTESDNPHRSLDLMVSFIARSCHIDVCSVYILDPAHGQLVLGATHGLSKSAIGNISMAPNEGLTGLALEQASPVFVKEPSDHPRFKYYAESGEDAYKTFLGLPLIYHQNALGVMVLQTQDPLAITEADIGLFASLATQVAATVAYTGILEDLSRRKKMPELPDSASAASQDSSFSTLYDREHISEPKNFLRGISVSAGFAQGHAAYMMTSIGFDQIDPKVITNQHTELKRLESAFEKSADDVKTVMHRVKDLSIDEAAILEAHLMYLSDDTFKKKIAHHIHEGFCAEYALKKEVLAHIDFFKKLDDPYLRDRALDIEDIGKRVLGHLIGYSHNTRMTFKKPTILFAADISPVDLVNLNQENLKGIVLSKGGKTSHAVILAKSFEIPIIVGVRGVLKSIRQDDPVIMDAVSGIVFRNPPEAIQQEYQRLTSERSREIEQLAAFRDIPAVTVDGFEVQIAANIGLISDLELVDKYGADFIGLYRTEFPFLIRNGFPSEEEQFELYSRVVEKARGKSVTIRTIDIGGDKFLNYLDSEKEANPFLGWRSVRISLEKEDIFREQIRAVLRVSALGDVRLLFPMITTVDEVHRIRAIISEEKTRLKTVGHAFNENIPVGIMVEVPGVIRILDRLMTFIDFVSIGTNDLIQYLLAVDRNNEKVSHLYNPLHPAVIGTILDITQICRKYGKSACICGEAAANLACVALFVAMGADCLSMNPAAVPVVKKFITGLNHKDLAGVLDQVLVMTTAEEIQQFLLKRFNLKNNFAQKNPPTA